jgi:DNA-binding transcriptional ArsR family regulator
VVVRAAAPQPEVRVSGLDATLAALAEPKRRAAVELLRKGPRRAGELAEALDLSPPAMSRHLRVLRTAGLVSEEHGGEDARVRVYGLSPAPIAELKGWVDELESFWSAQLQSFKRHAERKTRKAPRR